MLILILNSGSSSIKFKLFDMQTNTALASGLVEAINEPHGAIKITDLINSLTKEEHFFIPDHSEGLKHVQKLLAQMGILKSLDELDAIGHRIVQGAQYFAQPTLIDDDVISKIEEIIPLAPLHNPAHLKGIRTAKEQAKNVPQVAVFDTAFHQTMPKEAYLYALSYDFYKDYHIRRYGFHGTSHSFVSKKAAEFLGIAYDKFNAITLHLGNGSSACAIKNGQSVDTSMGLTPLEGLIMGTRCGDMDPSIIEYLHEKTGKNINEITTMLNKKSGFKGICGHGDLRHIRDLVNQGDKRAKIALDMAAYRLKKYIGAYHAILGRIDAIIFTAGIGENSALMRELTCKGLEHLGICIDDEKNTNEQCDIKLLCSKESRVKILKVATDEEYSIAQQTEQLVKNLKNS